MASKAGAKPPEAIDMLIRAHGMLNNFFIASPIVSLRCVRQEKVLAVYADGSTSTLSLDDLGDTRVEPLQYTEVHISPPRALLLNRLGLYRALRKANPNHRPLS